MIGRPTCDPTPDRMTAELSVCLRRLRSDDAGDILSAFRSNRDMVRQGSVETLSDAEAYAARLLDPVSSHEPWAIADAERLLGLVCISVDEENRSGWFWYWMADSARGRGLTGRAAATAAHWALTERGLERLELGHRVNNPASGAVARAAGFVREGTERGKFLVGGTRVDVDIYGRLASDPEPTFAPLPMISDAHNWR